MTELKRIQQHSEISLPCDLNQFVRSGGVDFSTLVVRARRYCVLGASGGLLFGRWITIVLYWALCQPEL